MFVTDFCFDHKYKFEELAVANWCCFSIDTIETLQHAWFVIVSLKYRLNISIQFAGVSNVLHLDGQQQNKAKC